MKWPIGANQEKQGLSEEEIGMLVPPMSSMPMPVLTVGPGGGAAYIGGGATHIGASGGNSGNYGGGGTNVAMQMVSSSATYSSVADIESTARA